ncbi:BspA family leucine-rich repeat surface protein [Bifidobacterium sp. ESL0775]|uniref:BspA family leucine-rich repeat surface protein n=1 Tax=Bifidobacterium sp. ESL0775 TaxID=2983230 RepID=UPI0023F7629D|nr:BspA family leucine-rich repeat surface protein [Bifidobacterium sp. ESL0775]WEV69513.1 BspA family leucine-rich repeat surface protein [Bifidobacterium sp. ESL0775]
MYYSIDGNPPRNTSVTEGFSSLSDTSQSQPSPSPNATSQSTVSSEPSGSTHLSNPSQPARSSESSAFSKATPRRNPSASSVVRPVPRVLGGQSGAVASLPADGDSRDASVASPPLTRSEPQVGPQSGCAADSGLWGSARWNLYADCALVIHGGDTGTTTSASMFGDGNTTGTIANSVTGVTIDGALTIRSENAFANWHSLGSVVTAASGRVTLAGGGGWRMFGGDTSLTSLDLRGWDVSQAAGMPGMFQNDTSLTTLDLSGWDVSGIGNMEGMFYGDASLSRLDLSRWKTSDTTTNKNIMFRGCTSLTSIDATNWSTTTNHYDNWFSTAPNLKAIDATGWSMAGVTYLQGVFSNCPKLQTITGVGAWDTSHITNTMAMFQSDTSLASLDLHSWNIGNLANMGGMFGGDTSLASLDLHGWDVSKTTNMQSMFQNDASLSRLNLSGWKTSNATTYKDYMFTGCTSLATVDVAHWSTTTGKYDNWFSTAPNLTTLDASTWDTSNLTNMMYGAFSGMPSVVTLDVSGWDTSHVTDMMGAFASNPNLVTIRGLADWDVSHVTRFEAAFRNDPKLTNIDVSRWTLPSTNANLNNMFQGDTSLTTLDLHGWNPNPLNTWSAMLPDGLRMLALGPNTKLGSNAFSNVNTNMTWDELDGFGTTAHYIRTIGNIYSLAARASGPNPKGYYVDHSFTGVEIVIDPNGGAASYQPTSYDTHTTGASVPIPAPTVMTANKPGRLFDGWRDQDGVSWTPGSTLSLGTREYYPSRIITLIPQWKSNDPAIGPVTVHAPAGGPATVDITAERTSTLSSGAGHTWTCTGTCAITGEPATSLQPAPGQSYTLTASAGQVTDPLTGNTITGGTTTVARTLPYSNATYHPQGGTGAPTAYAGYADTATGKAPYTIPNSGADAIPALAHHVFAGWNTSDTATSPDSAYDPGQGLPVLTTAGQSTSLYAVWHEVAAPTGLTVQRDPGTNDVLVTATGKPWAASDTIHLCLTPKAGTPGAATCQDIQAGAGAWDGGTSHTFTRTIPKTTIPDTGQYQVSATLTTTDTWRTPGTVSSLTADTGATPIRVSGPYQHALPLTGGQPQHLATFLAGGLGLALLLLSLVDRLRHQRQAKARHSR